MKKKNAEKETDTIVEYLEMKKLTKHGREHTIQSNLKINKISNVTVLPRLNKELQLWNNNNNNK